MSHRRCFAALLLASTIFTAPAFAQSAASGPAPLHNTVDENGVDLVTGKFRFSMTEAVFGSGEGAITLQRDWGESVYRDNWSGGLYVGTDGFTYVDFGKTSDSFSFSGGSYTSRTADGPTLVGSSGAYTFTASDGTIIEYRNTVETSGEPYQGYACPNGAQPGACAIPMSILKPNGVKYTINWTLSFKNGIAFYRFAGVTSSTGYSMALTYATNLPGTGSAPQTNWYKKTGVTFSNSVTACNSSCPSLTYSTGGVTTITNALSEQWRLDATSTQLTGIRRPGEAADSTTIVYGGAGTTVSSITKDGVTTSYSRSVAGNVATTTITDPLSQSRVVTADISLGRITSVRNELNQTTSYQYDTSGRLTRVTAPEGNYVDYAYDARGNVTSTTTVAKAGSGLGNIIASASYDATCTNPKTCNQPNSTTDVRGNVTNYTYDGTHGGVTAITRPAPTSGAIRPEVRIAYTAQAAPVAGNPNIYLPTSSSQCQTSSSCAGGADEVKSTVTYGNNLLPTSVSSGSGNGSLTATTGMTYDPAGNLLTVDGPLAGAADTTRYRYDAARRQIGTTSPDPDGAGALKMRAVRVTYRPDSQISKQELGTVNSQSDADWAAFATLQTVDLTYNSNARPVTSKLSAGGTAYALSQTSYDSLGRVDCTAVRMNTAVYGSLPASACSLGTQGSFGADRITKVGYDAASRPIQNIVAYGTADQATERTLTYTTNGQLATLLDGENNLTTYEYDGIDRLLKTRYPVSTKGANSSSTTDYEQLSRDPAGNVTSRRLRDGNVIGYTYDNLNRLTFKNVPGSEPDVTWAYDNLDRPTSISQTGHALTYAYDALSRVLTQGAPLGAVASEYDLAGRRTKITYPGAGLFVNYDYLVTGEISAIRENGATSGIGVLAALGYDNLGNRTSLTFGNGAAQSYSLDPVSRLASLTANLSGTANDLTIGSIAYNPASQITSINRSNDTYAWNGHYNVNRGYTSNGLNQLTTSGSVTPTYDARGNLTSAGSAVYTYSSENMLTSSTGGAGALLNYDPLLRLNQVMSGPTYTTFMYDGARTIAEYDPSNTVLRRYVFGAGLDEVLVQYEGSGTTTRRFLHADERGSIVAVSDSSGAVFAKNTYDEYGIPGASNYGRFQYTGQMWLPELGMYHYKARIYSPTLGRFLQTDPIGYGNGPNWYNYVGGDPTNYIDPLGLDDAALSDWVPGGCITCNATTWVVDTGNGLVGAVVGQREGLDGEFHGLIGFGSGGRYVYNLPNATESGAGSPAGTQNPATPCSSGHSDADAVAKWAGNVALAADVVAAGAGIAAIGTSWTGVGGIGFGSIAAGAKFVSISATGVQAATQYVSGDMSGLKSTAFSSLIGLTFPGMIGAKQAIYGVGKTARDAFARDAVGISMSQLTSVAMCKPE